MLDARHRGKFVRAGESLAAAQSLPAGTGDSYRESESEREREREREFSASAAHLLPMIPVALPGACIVSAGTLTQTHLTGPASRLLPPSAHQPEQTGSPHASAV
ncbi:hypothetical protein AAFF_G00299790 [Aldrovandia affinis]|uniref:Uncharacterized protein n=1 Tax=Aldrovandia affinis TaxID=143900 RepID=A0AAD7RAZ5_9TELE|nr:hypothetical protein AAFF_G00299790 [Aldrovandia affinis]